MQADCRGSSSSARNRRNLIQLNFCRLTVDGSAIPETARSEGASHPAEIEFHQVGEVYRRRRNQLETFAKTPLVSRSFHSSSAIVAELTPLVKFLGRDFAVAKNINGGLVNTVPTILTATSS